MVKRFNIIIINIKGNSKACIYAIEDVLNILAVGNSTIT